MMMMMMSGELASSQRHDLVVEARLDVAYLEIDELTRRVRLITIIIIIMIIIKLMIIIFIFVSIIIIIFTIATIVFK